MKKLFLFATVALLFASCGGSSYAVHGYRFSGSDSLHNFTIDMNDGVFSTDFILLVNGKKIITASLGMFEYGATGTADWNGRKVVLEIIKHERIIGFSKDGSAITSTYYDVQALVDNERVGRW